MISGAKWMLMWRSGPCSSLAIALVSQLMRVVVVSVGRLRPPFVDDVQHYKKLLARHTRLELIEVREDEAVARRIPERSYVSLLAMDGRTYDSRSFARWLEDRRMAGLDLCFVIGGPTGLDLDSDPPLAVGAAPPPPPARPGRAARAALPRPQDPGQRAVPSLAVPGPLEELRTTVEDAAAALGNGGANSAPTLERPKRADFGDYSTNAALLLAPVLKSAPREVAASLSDELRGRLGDRLERVEGAGPGFLNLWLGDEWFRDALRAILAAGDDWGAGSAAVAERVNVEYVSANP